MGLSAPVYTAYLRVYEPLGAFAPPERAQWRLLAESGQALDPSAGAAREFEEALRALVGAPPRLPGAGLPSGGGGALEDRAYVRMAGGQCWVCPWDTRLRSLLAVAQLGREVPEQLIDAALLRPLADAAGTEIDQMAREGSASGPAGRRVPHMQTATWHIPLPWFLPFVPDERALRLGRRRDGVRALRYEAGMADARRRVARALATLRKAIPEGPVVQRVVELGRWLEEFHPRSFVELDYGGLVSLLTDQQLRADSSVADLTSSLTALADGDSDAAMDAYRRLVERWEDLRGREHAS